MMRDALAGVERFVVDRIQSMTLTEIMRAAHAAMQPHSIQDASDQRPWAILLMGPTASGKTDLAVELVRRLPCEIVSVDSAMIYRGMDIGTAKPGSAILAEAPHRLIDILDPAETYSTARFRSDALAAMAEIAGRGRIPLLHRCSAEWSADPQGRSA